MNRVCACGAIAPARSDCPACHAPRPDARPSAAARGYDHRWHVGLRAQQLRREPRCQYTTPEGVRCTRAATDADHIIPKAQGGPDALSNLQSLCRPHHSMKTARENPQAGRAPRCHRVIGGRRRLDARALLADES